MQTAPAQAHHLPRYHIRPPTGYVNDPNGPIRIGGRWHLYFQYVADTARRGTVVWGHASSPDLAHWRLHRPAMAPEPDGVDRDGCWSGNAVHDGADVVAVYSAYRREHPFQSVVAARSDDGGYSFGAPVQIVPDPAADEPVDEYRDPYVWRDGGRWLMVVGAGHRTGTPAARLYTSPDLRSWECLGDYASARRTDTIGLDVGDMWECPQLLSFGDHDVLLVGTFDIAGAGGCGHVLALSGRREGLHLPEPVITRVDHGPNFYAASALRDSVQPVVWGWVTEGRAWDAAVAADWSGLISLPRAVSLAADGRLASSPVASLQSLRTEPLYDDGAGTVTGVPAQFEAELQLAAHAGPTRLVLACGEEHFDVHVDWSAGRITVDRDHASTDAAATGGVYAFDEPDLLTAGALSLRWYVDGSVSELFTGSGRCATTRFYPITPPPWRLEISGSGRDTARVWRLADRNPTAP